MRIMDTTTALLSVPCGTLVLLPKLVANGVSERVVAQLLPSSSSLSPKLSFLSFPSAQLCLACSGWRECCVCVSVRAAANAKAANFTLGVLLFLLRLARLPALLIFSPLINPTGSLGAAGAVSFLDL